MKRMMVLAHRAELIYQAVGHARKAGLTAGIEMAGLRAGAEEVVVSSVQTQVSKSKCRSCKGSGCDTCNHRGSVRRMERFNPWEFGILIIDEAHHCPAESYRLCLEWYKQNPELKILLVTATPKRGDKIGMHNVCDSVAFEMNLREGIAEGYLVPIRQRFVTVESLDLSQVGTKAGGDLADGALERVFLGETTEAEERMLHAIAKPSLEEANGRPLLVFASGQAHAEKLTAAFNAYDGVNAEFVIDKTDKEERKRVIERYKKGDTQVLVGCGVFTEGFDAPATSVIAAARPTKSESLYLQMIGRATRPLAGIVDGLAAAEERRAAIAASGKSHCVVLDFVGNSGRHKLVSVADVLAGSSVEPIDLAAALAEAKQCGESVDMEELLEKAKQAREEKERKRLERIERAKQAITRQRAEAAEYTASDVDLFGGNGFDPFHDYNPKPWQATPKQVNLLMVLGVAPDRATQYSKGQAHKVIDELKKKQQGGEYRMPFGKYKGKKLADVPRDYVGWLLKKARMDDPIRKHLGIMNGVVEPVITTPLDSEADLNAAFMQAVEGYD